MSNGYRKVSELSWKTVAEARNELGEEKCLAAIKKGVSDIEYRDNRNKNDRELLKKYKALQKAGKDPFVEQVKAGAKKAG